MKLQSIEAVKRSVMNNLGIAYVPQFSVEEELKSGSLLRLRTELDDKSYPGVCVFHKNRWVSPQMELAFRILQKQIEVNYSKYKNSAD
ncbi:MAG: LysR substrate-binding domain-containing protein [Clostridiales bacterium]|nr:LysR substrate-binding domain-containing protein [Clostridiales bacterium]